MKMLLGMPKSTLLSPDTGKTCKPNNMPGYRFLHYNSSCNLWFWNLLTEKALHKGNTAFSMQTKQEHFSLLLMVNVNKAKESIIFIKFKKTQVFKLYMQRDKVHKLLRLGVQRYMILCLENFHKLPKSLYVSFLSWAFYVK